MIDRILTDKEITAATGDVHDWGKALGMFRGVERAVLKRVTAHVEAVQLDRENMAKERDELKAEVERLKHVARHAYGDWCAHCGVYLGQWDRGGHFCSPRATPQAAHGIVREGGYEEIPKTAAITDFEATTQDHARVARQEWLDKNSTAPYPPPPLRSNPAMTAKRQKYAVYRSGRADGRPLLVGCLTECLKYAAHELRQGRGVTIEPED